MKDLIKIEFDVKKKVWFEDCEATPPYEPRFSQSLLILLNYLFIYFFGGVILHSC